MPQWLIIAQIVATLLPMLQGIIKAVEDAAVGQAGVFKKEQAMAMLTAILTAGNLYFKLDPASITVIMSLASSLIDIFVATMNASGLLPKAAKSA